MRTINDLINCKALYLYGAGNNYRTCREFLSGIISDKTKIFVVDSNKKKWNSYTEYNDRILSPDELKELYSGEDHVIVSSIKCQYEISTYLEEQIDVNGENIYMFTDEWYEDKIYDVEKITKHMREVKNIADKLADAESKEYYLASYYARLERKPDFLKPNTNSKYIGEYDGKVMLEKGDVIVDCGAYNGDTVELYMNRLEGDCFVHAFEPFIINYSELENRINSNGWGDRVRTYNYALGNGEKIISASYSDDDFGMALNINKKRGVNTQDIKVSALDKQLDKLANINYIKMDIEGEENLALAGSRNIIEKHHPKLMISGYHKIEDFWEIPNTIWSIDPNYAIYVGHSPEVSTEMEFYCI